MKSLMTAKLVDEITDSHSDKARESYGQGMANVITGFFGGMGGCAIIGQTLINVRQMGARTRLSTLLAGVFLFVLVILLGDVTGRIPMAALVAVMIMVAVTSIDWHSVRPRTLRVIPASDTLAMLVTVAVTLATHNLAIGVVTGVVFAMVMFARRVAHLVHVERVLEAPSSPTSPSDAGAASAARAGEPLSSPDAHLPDSAVDGRSGRVRYVVVRGRLFFASSNDLVYRFDYAEPVREVIIDLSEAEVWDASTVATLDSVVQKFRARGVAVKITGLEGESARHLEMLSGRLSA